MSRASFNPSASQKEDKQDKQDRQDMKETKDIEDPILSDWSDPGPTLEPFTPLAPAPTPDLNPPNRLRDALPPECLAQLHPVALLSRVYDPTSEECARDPNFFLDLEVIA